MADSFFRGPCRGRWKQIVRKNVGEEGARALDIIVLAPAFTLTGAFGRFLPKSIRLLMVLVGGSLLLHNAFNQIYSEEGEEGFI